MGMDEAREKFAEGFAGGEKAYTEPLRSQLLQEGRDHFDSAVSSLKSSGLVVVPVEATEGMCAVVTDGETPYIFRTNKKYDDGRIYEIVRLENDDWRECMPDDDEITEIARFASEREAASQYAKLVFQWRWSAMVQAYTGEK